MNIDYKMFHDLESYVFGEVHDRFHQRGHLEAFDFFSIVIWKANRAKSKVARNLLSAGNGHDNLDEAVKALTFGISQQAGPKERMQYLWEKWNFRLAMASAILTVLYPNEYTIYDVRVCQTLDAFHNLKNLLNFEKVWTGYQAYKHKVQVTAPSELSLRDKDRYLWGQSFYQQLNKDIAQGFMREENET